MLRAATPKTTKIKQSLVAQNRLPEAEKLARQAYDDVRRNLDEQHPALKTTANNLAKIYEKEGRRDLAEKLQ